MEFIYLYQIADTIFVKGSCTSLTSLEKRIKNDYPKQRYRIYPVYSFHHSMLDLRSWFDHRRCKDREDKTTKFVLKIKSLSFEAVDKKCREVSENDRHNPNKKSKVDDKNKMDQSDDDIYEFTDEKTGDVQFERLDKSKRKRKYIHIDDEEDDIEDNKEEDNNIEEKTNNIEENNIEEENNIGNDKKEDENKKEENNNIELEAENVSFLKQRIHEGNLQILVKSKYSILTAKDLEYYKTQGYIISLAIKSRYKKDHFLVYWKNSWIDSEYLEFDSEILKTLPKEE